MKCPCCNNPKEASDFYWRKGTKLKVYEYCKDCAIEKVKVRNRRIALGKKDFLAQYFN